MDQIYEADDLKLNEFRDILKTIKEHVQNDFTYLSQNTGELEKVTKRLIQFYTILKPVVYDYKPLSSIPITDIHDMFYEVLQEYPRSSYYQNRLEYYLKHDLIDFPFRNIVEKSDNEKHKAYKIIPNNIKLTK